MKKDNKKEVPKKIDEPLTLKKVEKKKSATFAELDKLVKENKR